MDGYICEGPDEHYVCDECFSNSVNHQFGGNDLGQLEVQNGQMVCQFCAKGDQKPISEAQIVRHAGDGAAPAQGSAVHLRFDPSKTRLYRDGWIATKEPEAAE